MVALNEVFGISSKVDSASYVDRGGLDKRFQHALDSDRHIAVHGGSKQGKSWLRAKGLPAEETLLVQCTPSSTPASLLNEALGHLGVNATLAMTKTRDIGGSLDFTGSGELGKLVAKLKLEGHGELRKSTAMETQLQPIGRTTADLSWVTLTILASRRRLVLEDFHYLGEDMQREFAFMLKAMGSMGCES